MPTLTLDSMWVVTKRLARSSMEDTAALAASLGGTLPHSHRAFLERFGAGSFVGVLRVLGPAEILAQRDLVREHRVFAPEHAKVWPDFAGLVNANEAERLVPVAVSIDGDMLTVNLDRPDMLFVFPRHREDIELAEDFTEALGWFSHSGSYWERSKKPWFESHVGRVEHEVHLTGAGDPYESISHLLDDLPPDHEGVELNPSNELFYVDGDVVVQWIGKSTFRVRTDESACDAFLARFTESLARAGFQATVTRQKHPFF